MNIKKPLAILISLLMMCAILTACGGGSSNSDNSNNSPSGQAPTGNTAADSGNNGGEKLEELKALYNTLVTIHNGSTALVNQCQDNDVEVSDEMIETINSIKADLDVYRERLAAPDAANTMDLDSEIAKIQEDIDAVRALNATISSDLEELGLEVEYIEVD